jgi:hypothetical protein
MTIVNIHYDGQLRQISMVGEFKPDELSVDCNGERYYLQKCTSYEEEHSVEFRIARHQKTCFDLGVPDFTPESGICWHCKRQIFNKRDGCEPITGCPYCNHSFVD